MKNFNLVLKKAKKNNLESQKRLGFFYYKKQDYKNALFWWKKALLLGDTAQNFNIGNCYHEGWGVKRNFKKALKYFLNCRKKKIDFMLVHVLILEVCIKMAKVPKRIFLKL